MMMVERRAAAQGSVKRERWRARMQRMWALVLSYTHFNSIQILNIIDNRLKQKIAMILTCGARQKPFRRSTIYLKWMDAVHQYTREWNSLKPTKNVLPRKRNVVAKVCEETYSKNDK